MTSVDLVDLQAESLASDPSLELEGGHRLVLPMPESWLRHRFQPARRGSTALEAAGFEVQYAYTLELSDRVGDAESRSEVNVRYRPITEA